MAGIRSFVGRKVRNACDMGRGPRHASCRVLWWWDHSWVTAAVGSSGGVYLGVYGVEHFNEASSCKLQRQRPKPKKRLVKYWGLNSPPKSLPVAFQIQSIVEGWVSRWSLQDDTSSKCPTPYFHNSRYQNDKLSLLLPLRSYSPASASCDSRRDRQTYAPTGKHSPALANLHPSAKLPFFVPSIFLSFF